MGYAVYNTQKGKGSGGGLGNHIDRTKGMEHTFSTADPSRLKHNKNFSLQNNYHLMSIPEAIDHRIKNGYTSTRKIRTDAVKYMAHVLTGTHDDVMKIFKEGKANEWVQANYKFMCQEFGKENIVRFTLHLDEKTPHIHCVTVPITEDGKLSCKSYMNGTINMKKRQDRYAEMMKPFGLERGIESKKTHTTKAEWERDLMVDELRVLQKDLDNIKMKLRTIGKDNLKELQELRKQIDANIRATLQKTEDLEKKKHRGPKL